jgi:uncharacterized protein
MSNVRYFIWSFFVTIAGLTGAFFLGGWHAVFIVAILCILEISLSFDNAVVNAKVLEDLDKIWRKRFLTWGMLIAVFGMRLIFPLLIVGIVANLGPLETLNLAMNQPDEYSKHLHDAHYMISAFGGSFLMMIGLKYFFDAEKDVHWISVIEKPLSKFSKIEAVEIAIVMVLLWITTNFIPETAKAEFVIAGMLGLIMYVAVDGFGSFMEQYAGKLTIKQHLGNTTAKSGLALFLYLQVLDASFSFDGVIGAFVISNNLFIIAIGLGVGAMFVRSLTIMLVDKGTLAKYRYLEHGAFYAILVLASIMFLKTFIEIPEIITGLLSAGFIGLAFMSSVRYSK